MKKEDNCVSILVQPSFYNLFLQFQDLIFFKELALGQLLPNVTVKENLKFTIRWL